MKHRHTQIELALMEMGPNNWITVATAPDSAGIPTTVSSMGETPREAVQKALQYVSGIAAYTLEKMTGEEQPMAQTG